MSSKPRFSEYMHRWERLEYPIRVAWYHTKLAVGIEPISDKNFLPHDFAMRLERGILPPDTRFTIGGREDGVGMQGMARASAINFAHVYGATYVDTPFGELGHVTDKGGVGTVEAWERLLNLGRGEEPLGDRASKIINYSDYLAGRVNWTPDSILRVQQCFWLYRRHPDLLERSTPIFQKKYDWPEGSSSERPLAVAVHVRRGDVGKKVNALRYTSNDKIMRAIALVEDVLKSVGLGYHVTIHSQGRAEDFAEFTARGYALNLEEDAIVAMRHFIESDVFLMAKSSFSYLAALYNRGIKLYEPTFNPCLPSWIARKASGEFDLQKFRHAVLTRFAA